MFKYFDERLFIILNKTFMLYSKYNDSIYRRFLEKKKGKLLDGMQNHDNL